MPPKKEAPPYPEGKVKYKFKGFKIDVAQHTETLGNAYKTTRDVARELREEIVPFVKRARERVEELVIIIQGLRKEIREARDALNAANRENLHLSLMLLDEYGDPMLWRRGDEDKEAA
ncbi:hypothetical protein QBC35DRAFT_388240 [Podospora australis]|uniref:Uncharacterized protein n=1 Tax=Podospora australis TaxID=1536484 RepID=A0AAN6WPX4_9PEZI|nr:hypothetical protein QBC35DRAFT_388240 [Podospora australis]